MDVLLVETDRLVRDLIKVGLQQFPEFTVTCGQGYAAINEMRQRPYDVVFVGCDNGEGQCMLLLQHLRAFDRSTEVVVVCGQRTAREMHAEKSRLNVMSFVQTPVVELEFFRLLARLRSRQTAAEPARGATPARRPAPPARV